MERKDWVVKEDVSMVVLLVGMVYWVQCVEKAFDALQAKKAGAMKTEFDREVEELTNLIKLVQGELTKSLRTRIMCMITMDTAGRDKCQKLLDEKVTKSEEFQWQSILKPYFDKNPNQITNKENPDSFLFHICDARLW